MGNRASKKANPIDDVWATSPLPNARTLGPDGCLRWDEFSDIVRRASVKESQAFHERVMLALLPVLRARASEGVDLLAKPREGVMVVVEPRVHPLLEATCRLFAHGLASLGWGLVIVHGTDNEEFVTDMVGHWRGTVLLRNCGKANLTVDEYSELLLDPTFWLTVPHENVLVFQTDTFLFHAKGLGGEGDWSLLKHSYLGAPFGHRVLFGDKGVVNGNGGLSLRKRSAALETVRNVHLDSPCPEDVVFGYYSEYVLGEAIPPRTASAFSVETYVPDDHPRDETGQLVLPVGMHKMYLWERSRNWYPPWLLASPLVRSLFGVGSSG